MSDEERDKKKHQFKAPAKVLFGEMESSKEIAERLIASDHPHLATARIRYINRDRAAKRAGVPVAGNVYKMGGKFEYLVGCDFVIEIALDVWNPFNPQQRIALVDHLLTRCVGEENEEEEGENGGMKWKLRPAQVQEFPEVVARNGPWNDSLVEMGQQFRRK
jgi:hypothetical protein